MPEGPSDLELAIASSKVAARRRALIMLGLSFFTAVTWAVVLETPLLFWAALPFSVLLLLHVLASRAAGLRSRAGLMALAVQVQSAELVRTHTERSAAVPAPVVEPEEVPDRVARRAAAVGAETWEPVPVPPPTYTLKDVVHRPEPAPLDSPAASSEEPAAVSRGALPRRAADVERILAIESPIDELFEEPKVVNG